MKDTVAKICENIPARMKNPWFWFGLVGVILTAMGVSPEMFTNWGLVWQAVKDLFSNPFMLGSVVMAVVGVFVDPSTKGITDGTKNTNGK